MRNHVLEAGVSRPQLVFMSVQKVQARNATNGTLHGTLASTLRRCRGLETVVKRLLFHVVTPFFRRIALARRIPIKDLAPLPPLRFAIHVRYEGCMWGKWSFRSLRRRGGEEKRGNEEKRLPFFSSTVVVK